jgi:hypothetical protein
MLEKTVLDSGWRCSSILRAAGGCRVPSNRPTRAAITLDELDRGLAKELTLTREAYDPLLYVERRAYLQDALTRLPTTPVGQHGDLLPDHWQVARQAQRTTPAAPAPETTTPSAESAS